MKKRKKRKPDKLKGTAILKFSLEGKFLREYSSMIEAGKDLRIGPKAIYRCLNGLQKTAGYFQWRYKIDPNFDEGIFDIPPVITKYTYKLQPVVQYTLEGKFVKEYSSIKEAAEIFAVPVISITKCIRREKKSVKGYQWRLKKDVSKDGKITDIDPVKPASNRFLRPVCQFGRDGKFLREYSSMIEAGKDLRIGHKAIYRCLKGFQKTAGDFQWRYKIDLNFDEGILDIPPIITTYPYPYNLQPVVQYTLKGKFVREYSSIKEAAETLAVPVISIARCIKGKQRSTKKYQWCLKKDVSKDGKITDIEAVKRKPALAVCKFDMDGKFIREYPSMSEAARDEGVSNIAISARLKRKKCRDYQWRFKKEVVKDGKIMDIGSLKRTRSKHETKSKYLYPVCQYGLDGTFIREYPSIIEGAEKTNIDKNIIFTCSVKRFKTTDGFQWRFKEEVVMKDGRIPDIEPTKQVSPFYFHAVCQFERGGKFIREYPSIIEAAEKTNITKYSILGCAVRQFKRAGGFLWRFKEEEVKEEKDRKKMAGKSRSKPRPYYSQEVCQFDVDGTFIRVYPSVWAAANITDISEYSIFLCASKKTGKRSGYIWRFKKDVKEKDGTINDIEIKLPRPDIYRYLHAVCQFKHYGKFIREYPSILDAAKKTKASKEAIYRCTQKKQKTTAGFQWRLKEEVVKKDGKIKDIEPDRPVLPHFLRAVCQVKQDGTLVREYSSIYEASKKTDITRSVIFSYARRKAKNRYGYLWRFKEDVVDKVGKISDIDTSKPVPYRYRRAVCQFGRDGKFIREYPSILDAAQKTSIYKEYISLCAQRKIKITTGFQWRYKDDPEFKNGITDIAPYERKESWRRKKKKE